MELLTKLGIDWKLLVAQIVNFFILLVILYKFVYKPVLDMLEKRSKTIEKGIADARAGEERLAQIEKMRDSKMAETHKEIGRLLDSAKNDAEMMKKEIIETANKQSEEMLVRTRTQMKEEKEKMLVDVKREVAGFIVLAVSKVLQREFNSADQKRLAEQISQDLLGK